MSFLAQLRHKNQTTEPQGLQLCYFLHCDSTQAVILHLRLATIEQGQLRDSGRDYCIQRQQLQVPPAFLTPADLELLQVLLDGQCDWGAKAQNLLAEEVSLRCVEQMLRSQKCFVQRDSGAWRRVLLAESCSTYPFWRIAADGEQAVSWCLPKGMLPWRFGAYLFAFSSSQNTFHLALSEDTEQQRRLLSQRPSVSVAGLDEFFTTRSAQWLAQKLPLPRRLQAVYGDYRLEPVLVCRSVFRVGQSHAVDECQLQFRYQGRELCFTRSLQEPPNELTFWDGEQLFAARPNSDDEQRRAQQLQPFLAHFQSGAAGVWHTDRADDWRRLILEERSTLTALGFTLSFDKGFRQHYVSPQNWRVQIDQHDANWQLSLTFEVGTKTVNVFELLRELRDLQTLNSVQGGDLELPIDDRIVLIPRHLYGSLTAELGDLITLQQSERKIPLTQLYRLESLHQQLPEVAEWVDPSHLLAKSIELHSSPIMLDSQSCGVKAELRAYQWLGVCWLQHLCNLGVNGLLADDMGLGKTLQTLAHLSLQSARGEQAGLALIVAPTSLLGNWASEIERFCPHLRYLIVHGPQRHQHWDTLTEYDIVISSYHLILNDLDYWRTIPLNWVVLDEAQVIKNASTKISQAVKQLPGKRRLCLSGTPVENHLGELWSILDFLAPGILGSLNQFKRYFQKPIEQEGNQQRLQQLLQRISFMTLRRTKNQVAKDLPAKTLISQSISFGDEQMDYYQQIKTTGWADLQAQLLETKSAGQKQILLLTALTKLRQACCDPALLGDSDIPSAKRQACIEMVCELVTEGRSVLVFSQFTSMLALLATDLAARGIPYLQLTGSSRNRAELVDSFQRGEAPVFLISLKAGGVGLNLTRADTVIHFDPWWNAAAEQQATDRAHRIGQQQPVFVYKLIAKDTIEEKIAQLQETKALLSKQVNDQAQRSGEEFTLKLDQLIKLWQDED